MAANGGSSRDYMEFVYLKAEDLKLLMSRLEHWAHRLFPKLSFDDFIERLERLGSKKEIMASLISVFTVAVDANLLCAWPNSASYPSG